MLEWVFFSFLYQREHLQQVLMTYALILVFEEARSLLVGNDVHGVPTPPWLAGGFALGELMSYPWYRVFASVACIVVALALYCGRQPHPARHDDPRRREQPRHGARPRASTSGCSTASCSPAASRSPRWPA